MSLGGDVKRYSRCIDRVLRAATFAAYILAFMAAFMAVSFAAPNAHAENKSPIARSTEATIPPIPFTLEREASDAASPGVLSPSPVAPPKPAVPGSLQNGLQNGLQISGAPGQSVPWSIVILMTGLTLIPTILLCMTPFARLLIVFHFLRQALGLQTTPTNQTLIGLSLVLTFFVMQPVATKIYDAAIVPAQAGNITALEAITRAEDPMRQFMVHFVREKDVALFLELAKEPRPASINDVSMRVLVPAYIVSELKAGFQIGTVLFFPFLIVDIVVASITTSVGMMQLPPVVISTPLKLLLFLMVDGWNLLIGSLMRSFQ